MSSEKIRKIIDSSTPARRSMIDKLLHLPWFRDSSEETQKEILTLPEDFNGYIEDLTNRPDEIGSLDIIRLSKIIKGSFLITSIFIVRSATNNQEYTYEYVSWKTGSYTGVRGIIFLERNDQITHFLVSKKFRFSTSEEEMESIGGLFSHIENNQILNLPKKIEDEIRFHLNLPKIKFTRIIDLGRVNPDFGMTNNSATVFVAIINIDHLPHDIVQNNFRTSHKLLNFEIKIVNIKEFPDYVQKIHDGYFLAAAAKILTSDKINLES